MCMNSSSSSSFLHTHTPPITLCASTPPILVLYMYWRAISPLTWPAVSHDHHLLMLGWHTCSKRHTVGPPASSSGGSRLRSTVHSICLLLQVPWLHTCGPCGSLWPLWYIACGPCGSLFVVACGLFCYILCVVHCIHVCANMRAIKF